MIRTRRHRCTPVLLALLLTLGACSGREEATDPGFAGHWTSAQWGEHYILIENSTMKVIYTHDDGRVIGTLNGTTFTGWWTESPSRRPSADAGDVTFTLTGTGDERAIDGTWRYGRDGNLRENWDLVWVDAQIPPDIEAKFHDSAMFIPLPA
jgi:hypothetical protein